MLAPNRYRLRHRADAGHHGTVIALDLPARTDKLLDSILIFNNLINARTACAN